MTSQHHSGYTHLTLCAIICLSLIVFLSACNGSSKPMPKPPMQAEEESFPRVRFVTCPFELNAEINDFRCGILDTYENYEQTAPNARTIQIAFGIVPAKTSPAAPDPVVVFTGGPGGSDLADLAIRQSYHNSFTNSRDVILVDQRGAGFSTPFLSCDNTASIGALEACVDNFVRQGVELSEYRSSVIAQDFLVLREALQIPQWNVYGESYGPIPGLLYAALDTAGVRSVIFDSSTDNQVDIALADAAAPLDYITQLANQCAAETECASRIPDLRSLFVDTLRSFENEPFQIVVPGLEIRPVSGDNFIEAISFLGEIYAPAVLEQFSNRNDELIQQFLTDLINEPGRPEVPDELIERREANLMNAVVQCAAIDALSYADSNIPTLETWPDDLWDVARESVELASFCNSGVVSIEQDLTQRDPVLLDVPALILGGALDRVVSLQQVEKLAESFNAPNVAIVPKGGHGVYFPAFDACVEQIVTSFIDTPGNRPAVDCLVADIEPFRFEYEREN